MEPSPQSAHASTHTPSPTSSPDVCADASSPADARSIQPRIFHEYEFDNSASSTPHARTRDAYPLIGTNQHAAPTAETQDREKRGAALGTCTRSASRECRGGDALQDRASSHVGFDQFDREQTRGENGRGTCEGLVREAMRRIDRSYGNAGTPTGLPSTVSGMNRDMSSTRRADNSNIYANIEAFQSTPSSLELQNYRASSTVNLNPAGTSSTKERIDGLLESMSDMPSSGLALIHVGVDRPGATGAAGSGHAMLVQRLPRDASGDGRASPDRSALFDPRSSIRTTAHSPSKVGARCEPRREAI